MIPFVTAYPILTTRGRTNAAFDNKEGVYIQYIIKPQPLTQGNYKFVVNPGAKMKICKLSILHIGENFPCMEKPGDPVTEYDNIKLTYDGTGAHACGETATYEFFVSCQLISRNRN